MKNKGLKITLYILVVILISLISFVGIYMKDANKFNNIINNYLLGSNLKGKAVIQLNIDDSENEVIYDENGKIVEEKEEGNEDKYTTVKEPVNKEDSLNKSNYEKSKEIIEERLKFIKLPNYNIRLNKSNGDMIIEADERYLSDISTMVSIIGKIEVKDSKTDEVLFNNSNIKNVTASYQTNTNNATTVYLDIALNNESKYKIEEIKNKYLSVNENEQNTEETTNNESEENNEKEDKPTINLNFDNNSLNEVEPENIIIDGSTLRMPISNSSTNATTINSYYNTAIIVAKAINIGQIPVVYTIEATEYFAANYANIINYLIYVLIALIIIIYLYMIIKYKFKGVLAAMSYTLWIAILLLIVRYTNVELTISSILSMFVLTIINTYITAVIINSSNEFEDYTEILKNSYKKILDLLIVSIILFVVFAFANFELINSIGLFMFWGILTITINTLITAKMLNIK